LAVLAVSAVVFVVTWAGQVDRPFVDDDWHYLNVVQSAGWWHQIWNPSAFLYRPVLYVWFGLLHLLFGLHPVAFHAATAVVIFLEGVLAWRLAARVGLGVASPIVGAIVLLHASAAPPITWTSAASSPISVALTLGALIVLLDDPSAVRVAAAMGLFAVGLLAREVVIGAPVVAVMLGWARRDISMRDALIRAVPLGVVSAVYLIMRKASGAGNSPGPYYQQISAHAFANVKILVRQAGDLPVFRQPIPDIAVLVLAIGLAAGFIFGRQRRFVAAGVGWCVVAVLPFVFLVHHPMEPYYIDFALPGLALAVGAAVEPLLAAGGSLVAAGACCVVVLLLGAVGHIVADTQESSFVPEARAGEQMVKETRAAYPHPGRGSLIIVRSELPSDETAFITAYGDLFRVVYHDPTLRVRFQP